MARRNNLVKRGESWYVRVWIDGKDVWRSAGKSKQAAQMMLAHIREDAERRQLGLPKKSRETFKDWIPRYLEWAKQYKRSWKRDDLSIRSLTPFFGHRKLREITKTMVEAYQRDRSQEVSNASVNREIACLRKLLNHAVDHGEIPESPIRGVKMLPEAPSRLPSLDRVDELRLVEASPPWLREIIRLAVLTGCRQGELLALRWRHVDFDNGEIIVEDSKSGDGRRVPLHPLLVEELKKRRGTPEGYVLTMPNGDPPHPNSVTHAFKRAARKAERGDLRFHDLRHLAGTRFQATGANLNEVAALLGHKTLHMARRYAHATKSRMHSLVAAMNVADAPVVEETKA